MDSRFIEQDWNNPTTFDGIISLTSLGNKLKIILPIKKTKHFNRLLKLGKLKPGVRISKSSITFMFGIEKKELKTVGQTVGLDVGVLNVFTTSDGQRSVPDKHGHTLQTINKKLSRKIKGSKNFRKAQVHRTNHINMVFNQLDLSNTKILKVENIKNMRKGKHTSRFLNHFTYTEIFGKLETLCETNGVFTSFGNFRKQPGCAECSGLKKLTIELFEKTKIRDANKNKLIAEHPDEIKHFIRFSYKDKNRKRLYFTTTYKRGCFIKISVQLKG